MKTKVLLMTFLTGCAFMANGQGNAPAGQQTVNDETFFREHVRTLSSDAFGGRKPLSQHDKITTDYISAQFKDLGLEPANGNSYLQPVPLVSISTRLKNNNLTVKAKNGNLSLRLSEDFILWSQRAQEKIKLPKLEFVFAGFGINAPEYGWNDYADLDVKGKIVIILVNDPGFYDEKLFQGKYMTYYGRWTYKFEEAIRQGAAGAFVIHDTAPASYDWNVVQSSWAGKSLSVYTEQTMAFQGWLTNDAGKRLFEKAGVSYAEALSAAQKKGFKGYTLNAKMDYEAVNDVKKDESANVAAVIPGTDLKDEYIIYTAHWDHLGIGIPVDNDSIYNGAVDNATGVAALFLIANRFSRLAERPRRSILFVAVTGEESGLLGSEYYASHPLKPLDKTVVNINMDSYGPKGRTRDVILSAAGDSETDRYVIEAAAAQGRSVKPSRLSTGGGYFRSDHFNFAKVGVPVILARGGGDYIDPKAEEAKRAKYGTKSTYHQPSDEFQEWWDFSGSLDDLYLYFGIGLRLANDGYFPKWNDGIVYKQVREGKK
ncbi:MAG: M28 family peptidase [Tannerella sp.]|jgi:Zn-dependent M28 family amino/carboxypeptidase|nr:M28 family peptidase [Tannerella sp.]